MPRLRLLIGASLALLMSGCASLFPGAVTTDDRLAVFPTRGLPLERPVTIHWNDYQVPYIHARTDADLAFALGLVNAHLRGAQLELLKRVAYGRLTESVGPAATEIDRLLRTIDYPRAADQVVANWPEETQRWVQRFVAGINHYQRQREEAPPEFGLLDIEAEPWTARDVVAVGRLAGTDVTWLAYATLLPQRRGAEAEDWRRQWQRALAAGGAFAAGGEQRTARAWSARLLAGLSRSGSNSLVIDGQRSASGAPMIANDPHLGLGLPNLWLLVGIDSPSYHAVGMMVPGLPFVALGRNEHLSWGGTNMRAASSDLYDVSDLDLQTRQETLVHRFWFDESIDVRESPYGPVLSDVDFFPGRAGEALAVRWMGHRDSDEITAFLKAMRTEDVHAFRRALDAYAVSPQNMMVADTDGNIAHILATISPSGPTSCPRSWCLSPAPAPTGRAIATPVSCRRGSIPQTACSPPPTTPSSTPTSPWAISSAPRTGCSGSRPWLGTGGRSAGTIWPAISATPTRPALIAWHAP